MGVSLDIGVDLDDVCYDFIDALRLHIHQVTGRPLSSMPDITRRDFFDDWGITADDFVEHSNSGVDAGLIFAQGVPLPGAVEGVAALRASGHRIHIVTDRRLGTGDASLRNTTAWLAEHGLVYDSLTISRDKTVVPVDMFIDDHPRNIDALLEAGVEAYLLTTRTNQHLDGYPRVADWSEFVAAVERRASVEAA